MPLSPYHNPSIIPQYLYQTFYAPAVAVAVAVALVCHLAPQLPCSCCIAHSYCTSGILMHLYSYALLLPCSCARARGLLYQHRTKYYSRLHTCICVISL
jgi:hypothetical protein